MQKEIKISAFDYPLPDERIAKYPLSERDLSKLLVWKNGQITDTTFRQLPTLLPTPSTLVFNNTKVIQARILFQKSTGAQIEIFCLEPILPHDHQLAFQTTDTCTWNCLVGNSKKWKEGNLIHTFDLNGETIELQAQRIGTVQASQSIRFTWINHSNSSPITFSEILQHVGELPIPPYLNRRTETSDLERYQTLYSKIDGSVAAPTAGLHFTQPVMNELLDRGVRIEELTLHVGAGTFKPVKSETIGDHAMHTEFIAIPLSLIRTLLTLDHPLIAVGTTSVRTLESLYYLGAIVSQNPHIPMDQLCVSQWSPYENTPTLTTQASIQTLIHYLEQHGSETLLAQTQIMIAPGFPFRLVGGIITNFHQPQSTLLLLVSAFLSQGNDQPTENWETLYRHALKGDYRFLSYGDSSLLLP